MEILQRLFLLSSLFILQQSVYADFHFGMITAVNARAKNLDAKVSAYKVAQKKNVVTGMLSGTASRGIAISSGVIILKDLGGVFKSTTTDLTGKYALDITGMTAPIILEMHDGTTVYFSIAFSSGICNISPISDLIVRSYFRINNGITDLSAAFTILPSSGTLPTADQITAIRTIITNSIASVLTRNGLDSTVFDILFSQFDANNTGFDAAIDQIQITVDGNNVIIKDLSNGNTLSVFNYVTSGQHISITKENTDNPIQLYTNPDAPYNISLASACGGNPPYTFMLETGVGFQPLGMQLSQAINNADCCLIGTPSAGTESPFIRHFGLCVKDLGGNEATVTSYYNYKVSSKTVTYAYDGYYSDIETYYKNGTIFSQNEVGHFSVQNGIVSGVGPGTVNASGDYSGATIDLNTQAGNPGDAVPLTTVTGHFSLTGSFTLTSASVVSTGNWNSNWDGTWYITWACTFQHR